LKDPASAYLRKFADTHHFAIVIFPSDSRYLSMLRLMALYELLEGGDSCLISLNQADDNLRAVILSPVGRNSHHLAIQCSLHQEYAIAHIMHFGTGDLGLLLHLTLGMYRQAIWLFPRTLQSAHESLRESGQEFVGMRSVGALHRNCDRRGREVVAKVIEPFGLEIAIETKEDNEGLKIIY
jgi:hypothetical protein